MKNGVILINTSRGPLIVEKDLAEALQCGKVYAVGCDVVSTEPIQADNLKHFLAGTPQNVVNP